QLVEQGIENPRVGSSILSPATIFPCYLDSDFRCSAPPPANFSPECYVTIVAILANLSGYDER
ncbi:MAG: hypothetical protein ACWGOV_04415, partial [Acidiferrobacterales bacterium]